MKKIAIVTGASSGIGKRLAAGMPQQLSLDELWLVARREDRLLALGKELSLPVRTFALDLTKEESIAALQAALEGEQPCVKALVNASGYGIFERFDRTTEKDVAGMTDLNCRALACMMHTALPYCERGSIIVNIASVAAFQPVPFGAEYAATPRLDVRLGAYWDESPVEEDYLNPETPSMNKLGITAGCSFRPIDRLSVDFSFSYVTGFGRDGSYTDEYMLMKTIPNLAPEYKTRVFGGHYDAYALMPAIGISYGF